MTRATRLPARTSLLSFVFALIAVATTSAGLLADEAQLVRRIVPMLEKKTGDTFWVTVNLLENLGKKAVPALREELDTGSEKTRLGCAKFP